MTTFPHVLVLSRDPLLSELLSDLLVRERFIVSEADDLAAVLAACSRSDGMPAVVLIDALETSDLARELVGDPWQYLGEAHPALLLLAGSATPADVRDHPSVDRVLTMPVTSGLLVGAVRQHSRSQPRRAMSSGIQIRVPAHVVGAVLPAGPKSKVGEG
jgi:DNA-binding response OmpR family regulator